ncbi:NAD(P)H-dependent oxidoreductase [Nocardiopsis changdeensis]|uniref:NAD(P)H-dependent oxidoreductase n=1 Tax=Nocardiopsis changdeensis TaxID=2831969 RepID=A0ABX8BI90_9ACTN|nr:MULTISPECIES: NAD(P)H-dependent oxidoreductase [Nocardiopsis]QUX21059.1 NAD(P)H-dependent oxidoreductase [Nocardiopsis changdeensis]QYX36989.1 NAD(P)H-dependent oxidoreductase [Nocardiopsis sp. MT53]
MTTTVLVGNPRPHSRTATAGLAVARHAARAAGLPERADLLELAGLQPLLLTPGPPLDVAAALEQVRAAELLVVASPTYKATYTGLLKVFLDLLPPGGLAGVTAVPVLVMASPAHTLAVDVHLRPLLLELGATVPAAGVALLQDTVPAGGPDVPAPLLDEVLAPWAGAAAPALRATARATAS